MSNSLPVALVTGGSTGIGAAICDDLLSNGYFVLNLSLQKPNNERENLLDIQVDLADVEATREVVSELAMKFEITNVVHNAGVIRPALIEDVEIEDVQYLTNLHIMASITLVQAHFVKRPDDGMSVC